MQTITTTAIVTGGKPGQVRYGSQGCRHLPTDSCPLAPLLKMIGNIYIFLDKGGKGASVQGNRYCVFAPFPSYTACLVLTTPTMPAGWVVCTLDLPSIVRGQADSRNSLSSRPPKVPLLTAARGVLANHRLSTLECPLSRLPYGGWV